MDASLYRNDSAFLKKTFITLVASLYRNDSTFLKKTMFSYKMCFIPVNATNMELTAFLLEMPLYSYIFMKVGFQPMTKCRYIDI